MGKLVVFHLTEGMTDTSYRKNRPHPGDRKHLFDKRKGIRASYVFRGKLHAGNPRLFFKGNKCRETLDFF